MRASSGLRMTTESSGYAGPGPSRWGPQRKSLGPGILFSRCHFLSDSKCSIQAPGSRAEVIPLVRNCLAHCGRPSIWKCRSTNPGSSVFPLASIFRAPRGIGKLPALPTFSIRFPRIRICPSTMLEWPVPSMRRSARITVRSGACARGSQGRVLSMSRQKTMARLFKLFMARRSILSVDCASIFSLLFVLLLD